MMRNIDGTLTIVSTDTGDSADTELNTVPVDVEGELLVRGSNVMQRYFKNEAATAQALVKGRWLRTGDLGRKDSPGYFLSPAGSRKS